MDEESKYRFYKKRKCKFTKKLRRKMTPEEKILWKELRNRNFSDTKFRRQVNIGPYIADFLCWRHNLIIEIDGLIHEKRKEHDVHRDKYLRDHGFKILRITNEEVNSDLESVLKKVEHSITPTS
ncbi:MAG: endonuclease domain-containing protein [Candidatus Peribacteraceae bacterium]|nr:endonuclease domain-containing protein [Candidatus Peribacteraceae bacterium]MDP7454251.1 endonuclease domain-containing protein [Candidatus Peribacteraceae bacterium]